MTWNWKNVISTSDRLKIPDSRANEQASNHDTES